MDISAVLLNTQSHDANLRRQAEEFLNNALTAQMGSFMLTLTQALASEGFSLTGRQAAGLYLKNVLDAKEYTLQQAKIDAWGAIEPSLKAQIKATALATLSSPETIARHTGAQFVAKLGVIELPRQEWPELLPALLANVASNTNPGAQHASLETLGYICDGMGDEALEQADANAMLTAIVDGIRAERSNEIRLAAVTALRHSLVFVAENFSRDAERNHIMQQVCEATQCSDIQVRVVAFECIATIPQLYYEYLEPYMSALVDLSFKAVTTDSPEVGLQSLEFWSAICDEEAIMAEDFDAQRPADIECKHYIKGVAAQLIPLLTNCLTQQGEEEDDTWNVGMAGATCLSLVAQAIRDACVEPTMVFITANIQKQEWRLKEASIMAFGCILEGPNTTTLYPIISQALPLLMECMTHAHMLVRDTTAWAIGRICDFHSPCISQELLPPLMQLLVVGLKQEPRVAHNIAFAIHNLAKAFESSPTGACTLTPFFPVLFDALLATTTRDDAMEHDLRGSVYEALCILIQVGDDVVTPHILSRLPTILDQLDETLIPSQLPAEVDEKAANQLLICGALLVTIQRVNDLIRPFADRIMEALLKVFADATATAEEEAFMATGAMAQALGADFLRYMEHFNPVLLKGLVGHDNAMVCTVAVGVVGDLCRALEKNVTPFCDNMVHCVLESLSNTTLNRSVKPPLISCFGDIALSTEGDFVRYLDPVMGVLALAASACRAVDGSDEDLVEYMNTLRESILEAYTGIIQGLSSSTGHYQAILQPYLQGMGEFLHILAADTGSRSESPEVTSAMVGLIGDMASNLGQTALPLVNQPFVAQLLNECIASSSANHQSTGKWARNVILQLQKGGSVPQAPGMQ